MRKFPEKLVALLLSSVLLAVGGIALTNGSSLSASAEEGISPVVDVGYTVYTPVNTHTPHNTMVQYVWTGDEDGYMHIGNNVNTSSGYITIANSGAQSCVYKEVKVPSVGSASTTMTYLWAQSFYKDEDGDIWQSDLNKYTETVTSTYSVTESIVSGKIKSTYTTLSTGYTVGQTVYWTVAYNGEAASYYLNTSSDANLTWNVTLSGVKFTIYVKNNIIKVKASKSVTCSNISSSYNGYAAFAIYVK